MAQEFTDEELKDAGVKRAVAERWQAVMQTIWTAAINYFNAKRVLKLKPAQGNNEITMGIYKIDAIMVNNSYIEARVWISEEEELISIRDFGDLECIAVTVFYIIDRHYQLSR